MKFKPLSLCGIGLIAAFVVAYLSAWIIGADSFERQQEDEL